LFVSDSGAEIHTERIINNHTLQTYGKNNIIDKIEKNIEIALSNPFTHKIRILDVHVNKGIYQPKQYRYLGGIKRTKYYKNKDDRYTDHKDYIQYLKAWSASFTYKGFNLDINSDIEFESVPNALFKTYGTKKEISNQYLHSVHKGGWDYVKNDLYRNNRTEREKPINYINPYDEMNKNYKKMIKHYINQYEYDIDYEFDEISVDVIKDEIIKKKLNPFINQLMNTQKKTWN
jgi:hypothetical protein